MRCQLSLTQATPGPIARQILKHRLTSGNNLPNVPLLRKERIVVHYHRSLSTDVGVEMPIGDFGPNLHRHDLRHPIWRTNPRDWHNSRLIRLEVDLGI